MPQLDDVTFDQIKRDDPAVTSLDVGCDYGSFLRRRVNWAREEDCFQHNTNLRKVHIDIGLMRTWSAAEWKQIFVPFMCALSLNRNIKDLTISHGTFDVNIATIMDPFFQQNRNLARLCLCSCNLDSDSVEAMALALSNCKQSSLKELSLDLNTVKEDCAIGRLNILNARPVVAEQMQVRLRKLSLCGTTIGFDGCCAVADMLEDPESELEELNIECTEFGDEGLNRLARSLKRCRTRKLKKLKAGGNISATNEGWFAFASTLSNPNLVLEDIDLKQTGIDDSGAKALVDALSHSQSLVTLGLPLCKEINEEGWQYLFGRLPTFEAPLAKLDLGSTFIKDASLASLGSALESISTIEDLRLDDISATPEGWNAFFVSLQNSRSSLTYLDLSDNKIRDQAAATLLSTLSNGSHRLKCLRLGSSSIKTRALGSFAALLQNPQPSLEVFDINSHAIHRRNVINDRLLPPFVRALPGNATLHTLQLGGGISCSVSTDGWMTLAKSLCDKSRIDSIYDSNHVLKIVCESYKESELPESLRSYLALNRSSDNIFEVARKKIIELHFERGQANIDELAEIDWQIAPFLIGWIGRDGEGSSLMYQFLRNSVSLFERGASKNGREPKKRRCS